MDAPFSLYIDHQKIAPLVRLLENTVETCRNEQEEEYEAHEIRMTLYQEFLSILHNLFLSRNPQIKFENGEIKLQESIYPPSFPHQYPHIEGLINAINSPNLPKRTRGLSAKNLQVEMQLIQWIQSCDKRIFEKKEIDLKYQQLVGDQKKSLSLKRIKQIVQKFNLPALIVKTKNKEQHFFGVNLNASSSTLPKEQDKSSLNQSVWLEEDDNATVKNSLQSLPEQIKEQRSSEMQSGQEDNRLLFGEVMAQQQQLN